MKNKLAYFWAKIVIKWYDLFGKVYTCGCGHTAKWKTSLSFAGRSGVFTLPGKNPEYCPQCWQDAAIKCAWCGETILPGDPITLYSPSQEWIDAASNPDFQIPDNAVMYSEDPMRLVGCLSWDCCESGVDRSGFWIMPGVVYRVASPLEEMSMAGVPVIVGDLADIGSAIPFNGVEDPATLISNGKPVAKINKP